MIKGIKECSILYNPASNGFSKKKLEEIYSTVKNNGITTEIIPSKEEGHITEIVKEVDKKGGLILTLGGDGTLSEAYKGFNQIDQQGLYSHVPTGTANDMAKNYDVRHKDVKAITQDILNGEIARMDSFKVNNEITSYTSVFGYLSQVPYKTPKVLKKCFKTGGYILRAAPYLLRAPEKYNISYETDNIKGITPCILGAISNSKGFAGIDLYSDVMLDDGKLELLLVKHANAELIANIVKDYLYNNIDLNRYSDYLIMDKSSKIKLSFNGTYPKYAFDNDGEKSSVKPDENNNEITIEVAKPIMVLKRKGN